MFRSHPWSVLQQATNRFSGLQLSPPNPQHFTSATVGNTLTTFKSPLGIKFYQPEYLFLLSRFDF